MVLRTFRKADLILALVIVGAAAAIVAGQSLGRSRQEGTVRAREVVIEVNNQHFRTVPFSQVTGVMTVDVPADRGRTVVVEITEDGRARVRASDCPDKVCVKTGWIEHPGEVIVCLPNRVVVKIQGGPEALGPALDGIAY
ncbi:MAG: NusG domain II-containing protein [Firmicutes bacterium]|nr:NusG domain II-containing protein [Bacillota bacterium]